MGSACLQTRHYRQQKRHHEIHPDPACGSGFIIQHLLQKEKRRYRLFNQHRRSNISQPHRQGTYG